MARLDRVSLRGADLRGADMTGALLEGAKITGVDLDEATLPQGAAEVWIGKPAAADKPPQHCR